ncbi:MAG TPA: NYN domain-containing protein, partial [Acidimicrobiales bacterium]|nr:NYN domain-containing protein [Acidimicrobiales bacterium]
SPSPSPAACSTTRSRRRSTCCARPAPRWSSTATTSRWRVGPSWGAAQRRRLVVALSDLAARTSTRVELVFDGAEVEPLTAPAPTRPLVRVRFSDPGVEADDVVIDLVGRIPAATPVIVASSDNRVRAGSRRWGANLLHARQLVDVLRR